MTRSAQPSTRSATRAVALVAALLAGVVSLIGPTPQAGAFDVHDPIGSVDSTFLGRHQGQFYGLIWGEGSWRLRGWAADVDAPWVPTEVHVYVNDAGSITQTGWLRPDVQAAYPWSGPNAGFEVAVDATAGDRVCAYAINAGAGSANTPLGCRTVPPFGSTDAGDPFGALDEVSTYGETVRLRGWTVDPDQPALPLFVNVSIDGLPLTTLYAQHPRPDVGAAVPGAGATHGFDQRLPVPPGRHMICAAAINIGANGINNVNLGCPIVDVAGAPSAAPLGALDSLFIPDGPTRVVTLHGWSWDPTTPPPTRVRVRYEEVRSHNQFVVSDGETTFPTGEFRPDVAVVFPAAGSATGFSGWLRFSLFGMPYHVCAYAVQTDGSEVPLACQLGGSLGFSR